MRLRTGRLGAVALTAGMLGASLGVGAASAAPPAGCGTVITQSTTLTADIRGCNQNGIVIAADNVTVDLGGKTIEGKARQGDGVGILIEGRTGVTVKNGVVRRFDAGVAIVGGGGNTVQNVTARDNIGALKNTDDYGEGISIRSSSDNTITANTVFHNGPFAGISVLGSTTDPALGSHGNVITGNRVVDNDIPSGEFGPNQDDGIRIEGPNATNTRIAGNEVRGNGLDGIAVFADQQTGLRNTGTVIEGNVIEANGFHEFGHRKGDGIILFGLPTNPAVGGADSTLVQDNDVKGNAANGIRVNAVNNSVLGNTATGNAAYPGVINVFDLNDINPTCDNNVWSGNVFGTANRACIS